MVFGNLEAERQELHHVGFVISTNLLYSEENTSGGGWPKFTKRKCPVGAYLTVHHGRDLTRRCRSGRAPGVAGRDRPRKPKIDPFEYLRSRSSIAV